MCGGGGGMEDGAQEGASVGHCVTGIRMETCDPAYPSDFAKRKPPQHAAGACLHLAPLAGRGRNSRIARISGDSPQALRFENSPKQPLTPTLSERASLVTTPQDRGEGPESHRPSHPETQPPTP